MTKENPIKTFIVIAIAVLFAWGLLSIAQDDVGLEGSASAAQPILYEGVPLDAKLLPLDRRALDEAYHAHLLLLFAVWLKDQAGDPTRFNAGLRIARRAYHEALQQIGKREEELKRQQQ